jgi:hypothetical protein
MLRRRRAPAHLRGRRAVAAEVEITRGIHRRILLEAGFVEEPLNRKLALTLLVSQAVLCGCTHHYLMKLSNGDQTISFSKPKLQGTNYHFTGGNGVAYVIPNSRVVKIRTISAIEEEKKPLSPAKPKQPKHWYCLWLA